MNGLGYVVRLKKRMGVKNLRLKFRVKFAIKACFEFFAHCDVLSIRFTRKNFALCLSHKFFGEIEINVDKYRIEFFKSSQYRVGFFVA